MKSRFLGDDIRKARLLHDCINCCRYIVPGETYRRSVWAIENEIAIFKTHYDPSCDFPSDFDEDLREKDNSDLGDKIESEVWLKAA